MFNIIGDLKTIDSTSFMPLETHNDSGEKYSGVYTEVLLGEDVEVDQFLYFDITSKNWKKALATDYDKMPARALSMESGSVGEKIKALLRGYSVQSVVSDIMSRIYISPDNTGEELSLFTEEDFPENYLHQNIGSTLDVVIGDTTSYFTKSYQFIPQVYENVYIEVNELYAGPGSYTNPASLTNLLSLDLPSDVYWFKTESSELPFKAYLNRDINSIGGSWLLAATIARDESNSWTYNNRHYFYEGADFGSLENSLINDYQNKKIWTEYPANEFMITVNNNPSKYMVYNTFLNNQTIASKFPTSNISKSFSCPSTIVGSWWSSPVNCNNEVSLACGNTASWCAHGLTPCSYDSASGRWGWFQFITFGQYMSSLYQYYYCQGAIAVSNNPTIENYPSGVSNDIGPITYTRYSWWTINVPSGSALNIYVR